MWIVKAFIRVLAFIRKELLGVLRQPRLILGLLVGPFLIMVIFGLTYEGTVKYNTILVVPDRADVSTNPADYQEFSKQAFKLNIISKNENQAINSLNLGEADVVIVVKENSLDEIYAGRNADFPTYYRNMNPVQANYIEYSSYVYASELNKVILREILAANKPNPQQSRDLVTRMQDSTNSLDKAMQQGNQAEARIHVQTSLALNEAARRSLDSLLIPGNGKSQPTQQKIMPINPLQNSTNQARADLDNSEKNLKGLEQGFNQGDTNSAQQRTRLEGVKQSNTALGQKLDKLSNIPAGVMVEPIRAAATNLVNSKIGYLNFFGPAVIILLIQHLAVTLLALSNVRDRQLGVLEIYRIAPVRPVQILFGKILSFSVLLVVLGAILIGLINQLLGIPFVSLETRWPLALLVVAVTVYASVGLGVLIAGVARTESQAVQWSMILLLASIFFTGFILPLSQFSPYLQYFSYLLPMTFGAASLQQVMLDNLPLDFTLLAIPLATGTVYLLAGLFLYRRQFVKLSKT